MFLRSQRFDDGITYGHDVLTTCDIIDSDGVTVATSLNVVSGGVTIDSTRKIRRQCTLSIQDPSGENVPDAVHDMLQPFSGYYFRLSRGMTWRDGTREMLPLGTFAPDTPRTRDTADSLEISVQGDDRSKIIAISRWVTPFVILANTNVGQAVYDVINDRMPGLSYNLEPTDATVPQTTLGVERENNPWDDACAIAASDGMELFFDAEDIVTLRTLPDPTTMGVVRSYVDDNTCTVTEIDRQTNSDKFYTGVIVYSEGSGVTAPIHVEVWREDTELRIPYFFPTALITTIPQALKTAMTILKSISALDYDIQMTIIPDPRIEVGDVVSVTRARSKLNDAFVINTLSIPMDATSLMTVGSAKISKRKLPTT